MTALSTRSKQVRRDAITLAQANAGYHFGGSFSVVEILLAYFEGRGPDDKLVFSKGHACWPLYVLLREQGLNPKLEGHPYRDPANGIEYTTGSLGHGFPAAVGMALAKKIKGEPGRIVCIIGEGDVQEGTCWESLLIAGHHRLNNLCVVVDLNGIQGSGRTSDILDVQTPAYLAAEGAGWNAYARLDGHSVRTMAHYMFEDQFVNKPELVFAHTIKGRGVSFMENSPIWHARHMTPEETKQAMEELA